MPFVGPSGQLLDKALRAAGFDPASHCYVTNVVKRRPPNNRNPTPEEVAFFLPFVQEELRLVDPWVVLVMGGVAARALLPEAVTRSGTSGRDLPLRAFRGQWQQLSLWPGGAEVPTLVSYHPSYVLRNPQRGPDSPARKVWDDIREVRRAVDERARLEGLT